MTNTPVTFPDLLIPTIIPDTGAKRLKTDVEMTYLKNNIIDESICQKLRNKDLYETYVHKIYNRIIGQKNWQLQENS